MTDETRQLGLTVRQRTSTLHASQPSVARSLVPAITSAACACEALPRLPLATMRVLLQVCRGTAVMMVAPSMGMEEIPNPFAEAEQAEQE